MGDLEAFVSPIDGSVITGRAAYRAHCKQHNVTNPADYKDFWDKKAEERKRMFSPGSGYDKERRIERLKANYKEFKNYSEFKRSLEKIGRR